MKTLTAIFSMILVGALCTTTRAATNVYDGFDTSGDYTAGSDINGINGGDNWDGAWDAATADSYTASSLSLSYTDSFGNVLVTTDGSMNRNAVGGYYTAYRNIAPYDIGGGSNPTSYFSLIVYRDAVSHENWKIDFQDSGVSRFRLDDQSAGTNTGVINIHAPTAGGGGATVSAMSTVPWNQVNFIVGEMIEGVGGTFSVWINPSDLSTLVRTVAPDIAVTDNIAGIMGVYNRIFNSGTGNMGARFDEFRISYAEGADMSDVVPYIPEPGIALFVAGAAFALLRR